jgi:hypothetical protein
MRIISSSTIDLCLSDRDAIEILRQGYRSSAQVSAPLTASIPRPDMQVGHLAVQPAWSDFAGQGHIDRGYVGCSLSLALPEQTGDPSGLYVLFSGSGGQPIALLDGVRLATWRDCRFTCTGCSLSFARRCPPFARDWQRPAPPTPDIRLFSCPKHHLDPFCRNGQGDPSEDRWDFRALSRFGRCHRRHFQRA